METYTTRLPLKISELKKGEYFKLRDSNTAPIWVRGEYSRQAKKYSIYRFENVNHERLVSGETKVFVNFEF